MKLDILNLLDIHIDKQIEYKPNKDWNKILNTRKKKRKQRNYKNRIPKKYNVYIKSIWWEKRKNQYWQNHKKECYRCSSSNHIQLHHLKYENQTFGNEKDKTLIPMCQSCHNLFHSLFGSKKDMIDDMLLFETEYPFIK